MSRLREGVTPAYLALCLVLGGSGQGIWGNLLLQLLALAILAWALLSRPRGGLSRAAASLRLLVLASVLLVLIQLVPLPPAVWSRLPGRAFVVDGYQMLGLPLPWLPISLAPAATLASALNLLPPLAIVAGILRLGAFRARWLAVAVVGGAVAGAMLGALQAATGSGYLYAFTTPGRAAGFFANANYMGTLLLAALPFLAALVARVGKTASTTTRKRLGAWGVGAGAALIILLGLALNGSAATALLAVPVLIGCAALLAGRRPRVQAWLALSAVAAVLAGALLVATVPSLSSTEAAVSVATRQDIWARSLQITGDHLPLGAGLGTFPALYPRYEDANAVDWIYVNHVHNDYLELVLEAGLPALLLLGAFLFWWVSRAWALWRPAGGRGMARAASIASAAILAHSAVDFPVRTAAIAATLAACVALMAEPNARRRDAESGIRARPARHLTLG